MRAVALLLAVGPVGPLAESPPSACDPTSLELDWDMAFEESHEDYRTAVAVDDSGMESHDRREA